MSCSSGITGTAITASAVSSSKAWLLTTSCIATSKNSRTCVIRRSGLMLQIKTEMGFSPKMNFHGVLVSLVEFLATFTDKENYILFLIRKQVDLSGI